MGRVTQGKPSPPRTRPILDISVHNCLFQARASSSPVILIGTHLDISNEKQRKACVSKITKELLNQRGFPVIQHYRFVNATEESDAMVELRKTIIKECLNFKVSTFNACVWVHLYYIKRGFNNFQLCCLSFISLYRSIMVPSITIHFS